MVIEKLQRKGFHSLTRPEGYFKDYDFTLSYLNQEFKFECKKDVMSSKTGNVAIEIGFKNNPSGIASTKADFYVIEIAQEDWVISVEVLKKMVVDKKYFKEVKGGDNYTSRLLLFKSDVITSVSRRL